MGRIGVNLTSRALLSPRLDAHEYRQIFKKQHFAGMIIFPHWLDVALGCWF